MRNNKFLGFFSAALTFSVFAAACSSDSVNSSDSKSKTYESSLSNVVSESGSTEKKADSLQCSSNIENVFSDRDLSGEYDAPDCEITLSGDSAAVSGNGAVESDGNISITEKGVYLVSGKLNDGSIIIDTDEKVQLVLNNAEISCSDSAVIYAKNSQKLFITVPENTESTLSDGTEYKLSSESENEPDACIFSADSLTVNGKGTLNINGSYNEGITSKDDIVAAGCTINVNSAGNGIKGKDSIALYDARLNIISGKDGLKTTNYKDEELGFIYSVDSSADIVSEEDGIQAETEFISENSNFSITSGGGFENAEQKTDNEFMKPNGGGDFRREENLYPNDQITASDSDSISTKGIKTASLMLIKGGSFNINAADDALHSSSSLSISGGTLNLASGDDGIHADSQLDISGGDITITDSYEGIESAQINICGVSHQMLNIYYALQKSYNTIPAKLCEELTPNAVYNFCRENMDMKLDPADEGYSPLSVGALTYGITLQNLVNAYIPYGNKGVQNEAHIISKIEQGNHDVIYENNGNPHQAVSAETAWVMNRLLKNVVENGTGTLAKLDNKVLCGKTGTTDNWYDLTFVGLTRDFVSGITIGYKAYNESLSLPTSLKSAKVWKNIIGDYADSVPTAADFDPVESVIESPMCTVSGMIAGPNCPKGVTGYWKSTNAPTCSGSHYVEPEPATDEFGNIIPDPTDAPADPNAPTDPAADPNAPTDPAVPQDPTAAPPAENPPAETPQEPAAPPPAAPENNGGGEAPAQ